MKSKLLGLLVIILAISAVPALAQDDNSANTNAVTYNGFSFSFADALGPNVMITQNQGDPADLAMPGAPEAPYTEFVLYGGTIIPAPFEAPAFVRVYNTADFAGYAWQEVQLAQLQNLLAEKPDLAAYMTMQTETNDPTLPFIPGVPAGQVMRARAAYVETDQVKGIVYMTIYRQDAAPAISSEFIYTFQGISNDGAHYISAVTRPFPAAFPVEYQSVDLTSFDSNAYYADAIVTLNAAGPDEFYIPVNLVDEMVQSLAFAPVN